MKLGIALVTILGFGASGANAAIIASNLAGSVGLTQFYVGQSFTTSSGNGWKDISLNFYYPAGNTPVSFGTGYIFSAAYAGSPAGLGSTHALGVANSAAGHWTFAPSIILQPLTKYYFYSDTPANILLKLSFNSAYSGGEMFSSGSSTATFVGGNQFDLNFTVTGTPVPEPTAWTLLITGFALAGTRLRQHGASARALRA